MFGRPRRLRAVLWGMVFVASYDQKRRELAQRSTVGEKDFSLPRRERAARKRRFLPRRGSRTNLKRREIEGSVVPAGIALREENS